MPKGTASECQDCKPDPCDPGPALDRRTLSPAPELPAASGSGVRGASGLQSGPGRAMVMALTGRVSTLRSAGDEGPAALAIVQAAPVDCGVYRCTIQNEHGSASTDFCLSPEGECTPGVGPAWFLREGNCRLYRDGTLSGQTSLRATAFSPFYPHSFVRIRFQRRR